MEETVRAFDEDWDDCGAVASREANGEILVAPHGPPGPGAERGLASRSRYEAVELEFEVRIGAGACFLAKLHQENRLNQTTNSYHMLCDARGAYLARHHRVFGYVPLVRDAWQCIRLSCVDGMISLQLGDRLVQRVHDRLLTGGHAFLGAQGGPVRLRGVRLTALGTSGGVRGQADTDVAVVQPVAVPRARVSVVTTVYDRAECLRRCIASVQRQEFWDYEHIIVSDCPPAEDLRRLGAIVSAAHDERIGYFTLARRHNNWGIAPAAVGLRRARGEYVCFLSDDNAYTPDHIDSLVRVLDGDPRLGFAYSSCQYDGRLVLRHPVPRPGRIDLGQPLFRRELFRQHFGDDLPFGIMAWDWQMIESLMARGVRWMHVDRPSFIFRLTKYPRIMAGLEPAG